MDNKKDLNYQLQKVLPKKRKMAINNIFKDNTTGPDLNVNEINDIRFEDE